MNAALTIREGWVTSWHLARELKDLLDRRAECAGETKGQYGRGNEHSVLDRVDRLSRHADHRCEVCLSQISAGPLLAQAIVQIVMRHGERGTRDRRISGLRQRRCT